MCIICNMPDFKCEPAEDFLNSFREAREAMKRAADAMLLVSKTANFAHRARYDGIHKEMVRQIREWNKLEEKREHENPPHPDSPGQ